MEVAPSNPRNVGEQSSGVKVGGRSKVTKLDTQFTVDGEMSMKKKGLGFGITFKKFVAGFTAVVATNMSVLP
ncbi:hypothetical protein [Herbaspirillum frisingense]|uniref:hypothetical protein n=1 Tax=Herbaspirillum frisingense TaxID=92645 RepID=UPI001268C312|nr:hypothetical protein [Herbaspirillum frisingense]